MSDVQKRGRGRPKGSGINDGPALDKMADAIAADPHLKPTAAARQIVGSDPSKLRRLQVKWKAKKGEYMARAQRRIAAASAPRADRPGLPATVLAQLAEAQHRLQAALGAPSFAAHLSTARQAAMDLHLTAADRAAQAVSLSAFDLANSQSLRSMQELTESAAARAIREFNDTATMRAMRELNDSAAARAIRELHNSPTMRAIREAQSLLGRGY